MFSSSQRKALLEKLDGLRPRLVASDFWGSMNPHGYLELTILGEISGKGGPSKRLFFSLIMNSGPGLQNIFCFPVPQQE